MLRTATLALAVVAAVLLGGVAMAASEGGGGLHAGQIVAMAIGIALAAILIGLTAGYILPKPPKF